MNSAVILPENGSSLWPATATATTGTEYSAGTRSPRGRSMCDVGWITLHNPTDGVEWQPDIGRSSGRAIPGDRSRRAAFSTRHPAAPPVAMTVEPLSNHGGLTMATYIVLGRFTDQGRDTTKRAQALKDLAKKDNATVTALYWTLGRFVRRCGNRRCAGRRVGERAAVEPRRWATSAPSCARSRLMRWDRCPVVWDRRHRSSTARHLLIGGSLDTHARFSWRLNGPRH
jgi:hypothetical protein